MDSTFQRSDLGCGSYTVVQEEVWLTATGDLEKVYKSESINIPRPNDLRDFSVVTVLRIEIRIYRSCDRWFRTRQAYGSKSRERHVGGRDEYSTCLVDKFVCAPRHFQ